MDRNLFRLVLLVSCAHALVHIYELTLPAVEQAIAHEYHPDNRALGKQTTGLMSTTWRLPFGFGALLAGWLVDRFGSRRMLITYLVGCSVCCLLVSLCRPIEALFVAMFLMGSCASVYHPAGLALISLRTSPQNRASALGVHGILGSIGISSAPMLVGLAMWADVSWRNFYGVLAFAGVGLALPIAAWARDPQRSAASQPGAVPMLEEASPAWTSFLVLTILASIQGIVYAGVLSFLPRYLQSDVFGETSATFMAAGVLVLGCIGQFLGARLARPGRLEMLLTVVTGLNVPALLGMACATGTMRFAAAGCFSIIHFMYQPVYNSLIAKYTPRGKRSLSYGFSFAMGFGIGGLGSTYAGYMQSPLHLYGGLAAASLTASIFGAWLWQRHRGDEF